MTASTEGNGARVVDLAGEATPAEWMALSSAAHWNQTEDDWHTMLALGRGWGLRERDEETGRDTLIASTLILPYGTTFAWVSMVLVLPAWRGRGHAQRLLRIALDELDRRGQQAVLDATPAGRPVYLKEGFVDGWAFGRWRRKAAPLSLARTGGEGERPLRASDWPAIEALDVPAFGASRLPLLRHLAAGAPRCAWFTERGYLLGREGRTALQLGPLVADGGGEIAIGLLSCALAAIAADAAHRDLIVDLRDGCASVAMWLREQGFERERPFTRMVRGGPRSQAPGDARPGVRAPGDARPEARAPGDARPEARAPDDARPEARAPDDARPESRAPGDARRVVLVAGPELG